MTFNTSLICRFNNYSYLKLYRVYHIESSHHKATLKKILFPVQRPGEDTNCRMGTLFFSFCQFLCFLFFLNIQYFLTKKTIE